MFNASYEGLNDTQRHVLLALAACARVTSEEVVACVSGLDADETGDVLAELAERSLTECVDPDPRLWTLHDVVRLFVQAQDGVAQADRAHLAFVEQHVAAHLDPLDWQAMEAAMDEVLAAVDRLLRADDATRAVSIVMRAAAHLMQRGRYGELVERYERLAASLPDGGMDLGLVLGNLGLCYRTLGDIPKAIRHLQRALAINENLGLLEGQAKQLGNLGRCYEAEIAIPKAVEHHQRALAIEEQLGRLEGQAAQLGNLGRCYRALRDISKAIEYHQRALDINEKLGLLEPLVIQLGNLGLCYQAQGDIPRAIEHHQRSMCIEEKLGRPQGQADDLLDLGFCYAAQGNILCARDHLQRALALYRKIGFTDEHPDIRQALRALSDLPTLSTP